MNTYRINTDPQFEFVITEDSVAADPTSVLVSIEEPDGTIIVDGIAATDDAGVGNYSYIFTTLGTKLGIYTLSLAMTGAGARVSVETTTFRVVGEFEE